jgi:hypothetical protein
VEEALWIVWLGSGVNGTSGLLDRDKGPCGWRRESEALQWKPLGKIEMESMDDSALDDTV